MLLELLDFELSVGSSYFGGISFRLKKPCKNNYLTEETTQVLKT